jgi:hypothetical protein
MAAQPTQNLANLGHKVTTRTLDWGQMCREVEGVRWNYPIGKYIIPVDGGTRVFLEYNAAITGPGGA